jgi:hypothetical protein
MGDRLVHSPGLRLGFFLEVLEVGMRYWLLLLVCLVSVGCGSPAGNHDPARVFTSVNPAISTLAPSSVPVNSVPFTLTVNGSDFGTDAVVFWAGAPLNTRVISSMQLIAQLQPTNLQFAGLVPVYVRTQGFNSNTVDFNVTIQ